MKTEERANEPSSTITYTQSEKGCYCCYKQSHKEGDRGCIFEDITTVYGKVPTSPFRLDKSKL